MLYLVDTSILIRLYNRTDGAHAAVKQCLEDLDSEGAELTLSPQVVYEFWTVATRPKDVNGLGLSTEEANHQLEKLLSIFRLIPESEAVFEEWRKQVSTKKISGKLSHDARLAAVMIVNKIENLLTLNPNDFKRFFEIRVVDPTSI